MAIRPAEAVDIKQIKLRKTPNKWVHATTYPPRVTHTVLKKGELEMSWTRGAAFVFVVAALAVGGCRQAADTYPPGSQAESVLPAPQPPAVQAPPAPRTAQQHPGPVVGHLKTRDKLITIRTGSNGPLYTVKSNDGQILAVDLPATELSAKFPELKDIVERGIADWSGMDLDRD